MEVVPLGRSGLRVSEVCLGTANFGWQCDEATAGAILDRAAEAGVNFIDTADGYEGAEDVLGKLLGTRRDDFIVATKGGAPTGGRPWEFGTSRKHLLDAVEGSLRRLRTDYVDVYFVHFHDPGTPIEETLQALDAIVTSGKARYVACSNFAAYQVALSLGCSDRLGLSRYLALQTRYSLLAREVEREMVPLCREQGLGIMAYNPLAGGLLTGKHVRDAEPTANTRFGADAGPYGAFYKSRYWHDAQFDTVDALKELAAEAGVSLVTLASAWVMGNPAVTSTIVGASRPDQLDETLAGASFEIDADLAERLDKLTRRWRNVDD